MNAFAMDHFDVFDYVKSSKELGVSEAVAEYQARQIEHVIEIVTKQNKHEIEQKNADIATKGDVRESELRLQKEIEGVRKEIKEVELSLQREIEVVRREIAILRYDTMKFVIWTGVGVSVAVLGGVFALLKTMIH